MLFAVTAGMVGFGGLFAMYSYVAPIVTDVTGLADATIPWFLLAFGVGSVLGSWLAGPLADWDVPRLVIGGFLATVAVLVLFHQTAALAVPAALGIFAIGALGSLVAIGLQIRLMDAAGEAQMLGAALNHSALNIANGLGAWLGGVVIAAGYGYRAPSLVGAGLAVAGLLIFLVGLAAQRASRPVRG